MRFSVLCVVAAAAALGSASRAAAEDAPGAAQPTPATTTDQATPAQSQAKPGYDPNAMVCKTSQVTGSRLGGHKVCHTRAEWDRKTLEDQRVINNMQSHVQTAPGG